ncbi:MAG: hypothetical protein Q9179_007936 [Wetmoreana sp. 5 TL-2023]
MAESVEAPGEYSGTKLLRFTAFYVPAQVICVMLRFLARYLVKGAWGLDDIMVATSLVTQMIMAIISVESVYHGGVGYHVRYLEMTRPNALIVWGKYLVAISVLYFATVNIPKIAILALYRRLFSRKDIQRVIYVLAGVLIVLSLSTTIAVLSACQPFDANWDPKLPGASCLDKEGLFRWGSLPNILTDIIMLVLPMRTVWQLQLSMRYKIGLIVTFAVGSLYVCCHFWPFSLTESLYSGLVGSIIRFATFFKSNSFVDGTWSAVELITWTQLETGTYLISACSMTYRPLLERIGHVHFFGKKSNVVKSTDRNDRVQCGDKITMQNRAQKIPTGFIPLDADSSLDSRIFITTDIRVAQQTREQDTQVGSICSDNV